MTHSRQTAVPIDHVIAELAAFPLASEASLHLQSQASKTAAPQCIKLDPSLQGPTAPLWRAAENHLLGSYPGFAVDELVAMRDRIWFNDHLRFDAQWRPIPFSSYTESSITLDRYVRTLAHTHLEARGDTARPHLRHDDWSRLNESRQADAIARSAWCWLALALPPDLLLGALGSPQGGPHEIDSISPTLAQQLAEQGFAETHLHVGAGLDFPLLWNALLHEIAKTSFKPDMFASPGAEFDEGRELTPWLLWAVVLRYVLAKFLTQSRGRVFRHYFYDAFRTPFSEVFGPSQFALLSRAVESLGVGEDREAGWFDGLRDIYGRLSGAADVTFPKRLSDARYADPIVVLLPYTPHERRTPEMCLIAMALDYLQDHPEDHDFASLFWQTVRVRSLFYRHVVQRPTTPGLQWFVRFFGRIWPGRSPLEPATLIESSAALGGFGNGLRSLEFRTAPPSSVESMRQYLQQIQKAAVVLRRPDDDRAPLELGLVYHFVKQRDRGTGRGVPRANWRDSYADPLGGDAEEGVPNRLVD